ncbi:hypothetical protein L9F63_000455 [Diploptera punctata]|uniref:Uncharacterized protein n=1 Tax=Diploptera punctata TaxID=6984 RepID=A0AAD8ALU1_DIPPU|nr:hypothetical protein L9F63_000455 [Diploptera punctata]
MILWLILFGMFQLLQATNICTYHCEYPTPRYVNCSNAFLTNIPNCVQTSVLFINLENNDISFLDDDVFQINHLLKIETLNLAHNAIRIIRTNAFRGLNNLQRLDLTGNELTNLDRNLFSYLQKITWLSLEDNKLLVLPREECFLNIETLITLYLSNTNISELYKATFECMPNLENIYLNNNNLHTIDVDVFSKIVLNSQNSFGIASLQKLRNLDLSGNPWKCDCDLHLIANKYNLPGKEDVLLCALPDHTLRSVNELMCYRSSNSLMNSTSDSDSDHTKAAFVLGIVIGALSASCAFILVAVLVHFIRKCWDRMSHRTRHQEYENID